MSANLPIVESGLIVTATTVAPMLFAFLVIAAKLWVSPDPEPTITRPRPARCGSTARSSRTRATPRARRACASAWPTTRPTRATRARPGASSIVYHGAVPSAFRDGRAILVDGQVKGSTFDARNDTLSTKCPSKYSSTSVAPTQ